jgi:hypothetical protein
VIAARVRVAFAREERVFRRNDEMVTIGFNIFAEKTLAPALVVFVGGVNEIAAASAKMSKIFRDSSFDVARPPVFPDIAKGHRCSALFGRNYKRAGALP